MSASEALLPLVSRAGGDILFRSAGRELSVAGFLRDSARVADGLPETRHIVNLCRDRYWFTVAFGAAVLRGQVTILTGERSHQHLRAVADRLGDVCSVGDDAGETSPFRHHSIGHTSIGVGREAATPSVPAGQLAAIVFTSGSTGEPVGASKHWGTLVGRSIAAGTRFDVGRRRPTSIVGTVPPWHMYGFETTVLLSLHVPSTNWCGPLFYPSDINAALNAVPEPRMLVTTPLQLRALLQSGLVMPSLAAVISATASLDASIAAEAEQRWGTTVLEIFGATEFGSIASRRTVAGPEWQAYDGVRFEQQEQGLVRVLAPPAPAGTLSDVVELLGPNSFKLIGRPDDIVKLGGRRASLAGLNRILTSIPGVTDGVFVPPEDPDRQPTARMQAYVIAPQRSAEDILADLRERIDPIFLPRRIVRVEGLPRNEVGKLPRAALLALRAELGRN